MNLWAKFKQLFKGDEWPRWSDDSRGGDGAALRIIGFGPSSEAENDSKSETGDEKPIGLTLYDGDKHEVIVDLEPAGLASDADFWQSWEPVRPPGGVPLQIYAITYNSWFGTGSVTHRLYYGVGGMKSALTQLGELDGLQIWRGTIDWCDVTEDFR
jgi:hypothetical protein